MSGSRFPLAMTALFVALSGTTSPATAQGAAILPGGNSRAPISINAEKLDYFDKEQKLVYSGAVVATQGDSTLKCAMLTIFLSGSPTQQNEEGGGQGGQVKRMEATGSVTIVSKDQVGQGDRGVYDKDENKVHLYGNVSLSQGPNVIKGRDEKSFIVYDLTSGRANVMGGATSLFAPGSNDPTKRSQPAPTTRPRN
jgi:lipopolysaccharide export system protein LptA